MATLTQHRSPPTGASTTSPLDQPFTPEMRDRQARGKNPYSDGTSPEEDNSARDYHRSHHHHGPSSSSVKDDYHERERKGLAMAVLDSPEKLLMYAQANDDSIAGQRLAFMRALRGPVKDSQRGRSK